MVFAYISLFVSTLASTQIIINIMIELLPSFFSLPRRNIGPVHDMKKLITRGQIHTSATLQLRKEPTNTHRTGD